MLTPSDEQLLSQLEQCGIADLRSIEPNHTTERPSITANIIRSWLLRESFSIADRTIRRTDCQPLIVSGVRFTGCVDLSDARSITSDCLPAIEFVDCDFPDGFAARDTRIGRLTLRDCRVSGTIDIKRLAIDGDLVFIELRSSPEGGDGVLRIDGEEININGSFELASTRLVAPEGHGMIEDSSQPPPYALSLRGAHIRGDLMLEPQVQLHGGLRLRGCYVGGDIWARGLQASDGETERTREELRRRNESPRYALGAQSAHIAGNAIFASLVQQPTRLSGVVFLLGLRVDGTLSIVGAEISGALQAENMEAADLIATGLHIAADASFINSKIRGRMALGGIAKSLSLVGISVGGECLIARSRISGPLSLGSAIIHGDLVLDGRSLPQDSPAVCKLAPTALIIEDDLTLIGTRISGELYISGSASGVVANNLYVGNTFRLTGHDQLSPGPWGYANWGKIALQLARLDGVLLMYEAAIQELNLLGAEIVRLEVTDVNINTVDMRDAHVKAPFKLSGWFGSIAAIGLKAEANLSITLVTDRQPEASGSAEAGTPSKSEGSSDCQSLDLANATIMGPARITGSYKEIDCQSVTVEKGLSLVAKCESRLRFAAATLHGDLLLNIGPASESILNEAEDSAALDINSARIKGDLTIAGTYGSVNAHALTVSGTAVVNCSCGGEFNFSSAVIIGDLDLSSFRFLPQLGQFMTSQKPIEQALILKDTEIGHRLQMVEKSRASIDVVAARWSSIPCLPRCRFTRIEVRDESVATKTRLISIITHASGTDQFLTGIFTAKDLLALFYRGIDLTDDPQLLDFVELLLGLNIRAGGGLVIKDTKHLKDARAVRYRDYSQPGETVFQPVMDSAKLLNLVGLPAVRELSDTDKVEYQIQGITVPLKEVSVCYLAGSTLTKLAFVLRPGFYEKLTNLSPEIIVTARVSWEMQLSGINPHWAESSDGIFEFGLPWSPASGWKNLDATELEVRIPNWTELISAGVSQGTVVILTNTKCGTLADADGHVWAGAQTALLENFRYERTEYYQNSYISRSLFGWAVMRAFGPSPLPERLLQLKKRYKWKWTRARERPPLEERKQWLAKAPKAQFVPQPYAQLASVLRAQGDIDGANAIEALKVGLQVADQVRRSPRYWLRWVLFQAYRVLFNYGLSPTRAVLTIGSCLLIGWLMVSWANTHGFLIQNASPTTTTLVRMPGGDLQVAFPHSESRTLEPDPPCGSSINQFLYAAEAFIPLMHFGQSTRCVVRAPGPTEPNPIKEWQTHKGLRGSLKGFVTALLRNPALWVSFGMAFYSVLGALLTTLAVLTFSGILRRWSQE